MLIMTNVAQDAGLHIRVERELRDTFVQACQMKHRSAADVLRDFMRSYTQKQRQERTDKPVKAAGLRS